MESNGESVGSPCGVSESKSVGNTMGEPVGESVGESVRDLPAICFQPSRGRFGTKSLLVLFPLFMAKL